MTDKKKDDRANEPEPGSPEDLLPDIEPGDPGKKVEDDGEVPGGGNFA